jgi:hypothetical protein
MSLSVPGALTADSAVNYRVSIRLTPGGLSFAGLVPQDGARFFFSQTVFDSAKPCARALEETVRAHPFLRFPYRQTHVIVTGRRYTSVPDAAFAEEQNGTLASFLFASPGGTVLHERIEAYGSQLVFLMPEEVHDVCSRLLVRPRFTHAVAQMLRRCRSMHAARPLRQLFVSIGGSLMDVAGLDRGQPVFLNSFDVENTDDMLYYVLYIWKQTAFDSSTDELLLSAAPALYRELEPVLRRYVARVAMLPQPAFAGATHVPFDMIALLTCES